MTTARTRGAVDDTGAILVERLPHGASSRRSSGAASGLAYDQQSSREGHMDMSRITADPEPALYSGDANFDEEESETWSPDADQDPDSSEVEQEAEKEGWGDADEEDPDLGEDAEQDPWETPT